MIDFSTEMKQTDFQTHGLPHQSKLLGELVSFFYQKKKKKLVSFYDENYKSTERPSVGIE